MRRLPAALLLAAAFGVVGGPPASASDEAPSSGRTDASPLGRDLALLASPYAAVRDRAVRDLAASLPANRARLVAAFRAATGPLRAELASVLSTDSSDETRSLLLDELLTTDDVAVSQAIRKGLVRQANAVETLLAARTRPKGAAGVRFDRVRDLFVRARVEAAFLSTKSTSGVTGYYRGQFDGLVPDREVALQVLLAVLEDRTLERTGRVPGEFPVGSYRWLVEPPFVVERNELRVLAANAIGDLMTSRDESVAASLARIAGNFTDSIERERQKRDPRLQLRIERAESMVDSIVAILARHVPAAETSGIDGPGRTWLDALEFRIGRYERRGEFDEAAALALRLGRYEQAIDWYRRDIALGRGGGSALPHYNIACAFSMQARDLAGTQPREAKTLRAMGVASLYASVQAGYPDWPWMEQDRDLDAIRSEPGYAKLLANLKEQFPPPPGWKPSSPSPKTPVPHEPSPPSTAEPAMGDSPPPPAMGESPPPSHPYGPGTPGMNPPPR